MDGSRLAQDWSGTHTSVVGSVYLLSTWGEANQSQDKIYISFVLLFRLKTSALLDIVVST